MKKMLFPLIALVLIASLAFVSCGDKKAAPAAKAQTLIGIAMPETTVQRWVKDGNQLKVEAEKRGYKAELQFADGQQPLQNQQIQSFLTQGAKVLVVGCLNDGVASVVAEANRDKVAVIAYDRIIQNSDQYDYYITFNNFKVGVLQGQGIETALDLKNATATAPKNITLFAGDRLLCVPSGDTATTNKYWTSGRRYN